VQSDAELVEAVLGGNRAAFAVLVERYERAVVGVALVILRDHHAAEDVAQEAFVTAYQRLGTLRDGKRFAPWLLATARRRAIDICRKRSKRRLQMIPVDSIADVDCRLDQKVEEVSAAIGRLPEGQQRVILHRYGDGLSVREIAEATGSPVGTVTKYLSRAHARLRKLLIPESSE
jgi:RNA polymerase sigma-70 factor (ECF subfamily)